MCSGKTIAVLLLDISKYMNNNYENLPAVLNANQLAAALGISRAGAYQLLNTGTFPTLRIGKRLLVPKDKLIDWIEQNTGGGNGS